MVETDIGVVGGIVELQQKRGQRVRVVKPLCSLLVVVQFVLESGS
ncbi:hypothetical protein SAMN06265219_12148, partial [Gracilimonas mengyeensis]